MVRLAGKTFLRFEGSSCERKAGERKFEKKIIRKQL